MPTQEPQEQEQTDIRIPTLSGDLHMVWKGTRLNLDGTHATEKERTELREWAEKNGFTINGDLENQAYIQVDAADEGKLRLACNEFLGKNIRKPGWALWGTPKKGRGRKAGKPQVLQFAEQVDVGQLKEVAPLPQTRGG